MFENLHLALLIMSYYLKSENLKISLQAENKMFFTESTEKAENVLI